MVFVVSVAMLFCLVTGLYVGWICKEDHLEGRHAARVVSPALTLPLQRLAPRDPPTGELLALGYAPTDTFVSLAGRGRFPVLEKAGTR
jgi:hypothetical protein